MILDNRQVVPDIIVSRDGVPNNSIAYNINNNLNNNQDQAGAPEKARGEGCSPRHLPKGRSYEVPKHAYVTGNNNGSPRHVPHNGNYYNEAKMSPVHQKANKLVYMDSPVHSRVIKGKTERHPVKLNGSPQHMHYERSSFEKNQRSHKNSQESYQSPLHHRFDFQRNQLFKDNDYQGKFQNFDNSNFKENPLKSTNFCQDYSYVSPVHQNLRNSNVKQEHFCSPKHQYHSSHLFSPKKSPLILRKKDDSFDKDFKRRRCENEKLRPRSSSHPCDESCAKSKIPVHIGKSGLKNDNTDSNSRGCNQTKDDIINNIGSPHKAYNKRFHILNVNSLHQKESMQDYQNQEYKRVLREYAIFSPKRVNSRLRDQNRKINNSEQEFKQTAFPSLEKRECNKTLQLKKRELRDEKLFNGDSLEWNTDSNNLGSVDSNNSWNIESSERSEEENESLSEHSSKEWKGRCRLMSWPSLVNAKGGCLDEEAGKKAYMKYSDDSTEISSDKDSAIEANGGALGSKIVVIKCKDANYLTRIFINNEGIHGLRVVGRIGVGGTAQGHVMSLDQPIAPPPGDPNSNHSVCSDDVSRGGSDVTGRDVLSETAVSLISQTTDTEFEHEAADYQWLLDYDMPAPRYRESYSKDSHRDGSTRVSVLQPSTGESHLSYETLSRNIDANLAEIDMDDFRSEDIHQLLSLPTICTDLQDGNEEDIYSSVSGSFIDPSEMVRSPQHLSRCLHLQQQERLHQKLLKHNQQQHLHYHQQHRPQEEEEEGEEEEEENCNDIDQPNSDQQNVQTFEGDHDEEIEEYSGVSGDVSLYQSGPLFSPLKEPPHIPPSFSVDSLDSDSIHEDLILTCQANKNNYTIAFEGSFVQYSDSDYQEPAESDGTGSGTWSTERLEGRSPAPNMTFSDQPYTTWSRVSRRSSQSRTPESSQTQASRNSDQSPIATEKVQQQSQLSRIEAQPHESKSNSMPNLMRRSLMRRSLETSGHCVKVYDLQNSLRSSQLSNARSVDANNFSLMRLFIKQKSLSKEAVSMSSSYTDPSQEGACSSSENQSGVNDSSDWPMNSQSENDMDGSASPVPMAALNNHIVHERPYRSRINASNIIMAANQDNTNTPTEKNNATMNLTAEGILNNNNLTQMVDNGSCNPLDNITSFEDSLKETNPCSKPPMTSPIREEPEGMDISLDSRCENKVFIDQSEKEVKSHDVLRLKDNNCCNAEQNNKSSSKSRSREISNKNIQGNKNSLNTSDKKKRSESPGATKQQVVSKESLNTSQRKRQDSGNTTSGYVSNKGSTERIRRSSESDKLITLSEKPKPKPRSLRQFTDQCLQTSNLKVSATVNTSGLMDRKEVYVYYPNYALPDLGFLKEKKYSVDARIFLVPQHYTHFIQDHRSKKDSKVSRPFSCGDMEKLKKHGFGHVKDWDSLNFLLPKELKEMLLDDTECMETIKPSFCRPIRLVRRPASVDSAQQKISQDVKESKGSSSSISSNQPSSGYRGSSTMLNDSEEGANTLDHRYVYRYDNTSMESDSGPPIPKRSVSLAVEDHHMNDGSNLSVNDTPPPRPPLPRGILRKCTSLRDDSNKQNGSKRHSAGEVSSKGNMREDILKRRSLQEPISGEPEIPSETAEDTDDKSNLMGCSCVNECTGFCAKGLRKKNLLLVDELPEVSSHEELTDSDLVRLRSQVSDFLASKGSHVGSLLTGEFSYGGTCDCPRKNVSFAEKGCTHRHNVTSSPHTFNISKKGPKENTDIKVQKKVPSDEDLPPMLYDSHDKKTLVLSVRSAVEKLVMHFNKGTSQQEKNKLGTSLQTPEVAQMALDKLCPAIYALLSDGLLPSLHSLFGKISNSVWRVVEATSQIGPSTKALNDLVLTLNSEECLSEGPIKFNAFIFGLLNIRSLDAWLGYLRTRESALQKHYHPESFLYLSNTATRALYDDLLLALRPLAILPFRLDLLHEYKALHASLLKMEERLALHTSQSPTDMPIDILLAAKESKEFRNAAARTTDRSRSPRPRSCHENAGLENVQGALRKRWSGVQLGSKLVTAIDKLLTEETGGTSSEDYTDSLDTPKKTRTNLARQHHEVADDVLTDMRLSDLSSRDGDLSERSATDKDTDTEKGLRLNSKCMESESEGERFRRLQLKWEAMTGQSNPGQKTMTREEEQEKERNETITSPAGVQRSRIPRPVSITSPQQVFKPFEVSREKTSPQYKQTKKLLTTKDHPKPAPRRSLKDRVVPTDYQEAQNIKGASVRSRVGSKTSNNTNLTSIGSNRASSVPGRKVERGSSGSRLVQTLHHRLATDNGHLSFSRGDVLTVIVEVDERFLLCCLHDRKGLVPRTSVVVYQQ